MTDMANMMFTWVRVQGWRSLEDVDIHFQPVTVMAGPNSSGKSSFVNALAFLQQALAVSPAEAFKSQGGVHEIRARTGRRTPFFQIDVEIRSRVTDVYQGQYSLLFRLSRSTFSIEEEKASVKDGSSGATHEYAVQKATWVKTVEGLQPPLAPNRLALPLLAGIRYFAPLYQALTSLSFYRIRPEAVRGLHDPDIGERLTTDGSNAASILQHLSTQDESLFERLLQALRVIAPDIQAVKAESRGRQETLVFDQASGSRAISFEASSMSAGTLQAVGMLLALYPVEPPTLVVLEEPETDLHPGAIAVLADVIQEAALRTQVLVTTHSPDLLSCFDVSSLQAMDRRDGVTIAAPIREPQRQAILRGLFTAGELHRIEGLSPENGHHV